MNDEIPKELQDFEFPELTNNQLNIWRLRDELNATRKWIRENAVSEVEEEEEEVPLSPTCTHPNSYQLKPGMMKCKDCKVIYKV